MNRRVLAAIVGASPHLLDAAQAATVGLPENKGTLKWSDYLNAGLNPKAYDKALVDQAAQLISDKSSKVYEAEQSGDYNTAQKIKMELLPLVGQYGEDPGIARLWSDINTKWNLASEEAAKYLAWKMQANQMGGDIVTNPHSNRDFIPPANAGGYYRGTNADAWYIPFNGGGTQQGTTPPLFPQMKGRRPIQEESIGETSSPIPPSQFSPAHSYFTDNNNAIVQVGSPSINNVGNNDYYIKDLEDKYNRLKHTAETATSPQIQSTAINGLREVAEEIRKLTKKDFEFPQEVKEKGKDFLSLAGISPVISRPYFSVDNNGRTVRSESITPKSAGQIASEVGDALKGQEFPVDMQERASSYLKPLSDKVNAQLNQGIQSIDLIQRMKELLMRDSGGEMTKWRNPYTGEEELRPNFTVGQGWGGLGEKLKNDWNPHGWMQKLGADPSSPTYTMLSKMMALVNDNNQRFASGQQTAETEAKRFAKIYLGALGDGDANALWSAIKETETQAHQSYGAAFQGLRGDAYIPAQYRYVATQIGMKDPYKTTDLESYSPFKIGDKSSSLPPSSPSTPSPSFDIKDLNKEDFDLIDRLMTEEGPFLQIKDKKKRMDTIKQYIIQIKTQPPEMGN